MPAIYLGRVLALVASLPLFPKCKPKPKPPRIRRIGTYRKQSIIDYYFVKRRFGQRIRQNHLVQRIRRRPIAIPIRSSGSNPRLGSGTAVFLCHHLGNDTRISIVMVNVRGIRLVVDKRNAKRKLLAKKRTYHSAL